MKFPLPEEMFGRLPALTGEIIPPNQLAQHDPRQALVAQLETLLEEMKHARKGIADLIGPPESRPPRVPVDPATLDPSRRQLSRAMDRYEMRRAQLENRQPDYLLAEDPVALMMQLMDKS